MPNHAMPNHGSIRVSMCGKHIATRAPLVLGLALALALALVLAHRPLLHARVRRDAVAAGLLEPEVVLCLEVLRRLHRLLVLLLLVAKGGGHLHPLRVVLVQPPLPTTDSPPQGVTSSSQGANSTPQGASSSW
eukprot:356433-Prorocentrum_minimum.AAC.2